jgi:hypothetical protein
MRRWVWPLLLASACEYTPGTILVDAPTDSQPRDAAPDVPDTPDQPFWMNAVGVMMNGNSIADVAAVGWKNSGAITRDEIASGDGYIEFSTAEASLGKSFGLAHGDTDQNYTDIDFAFQLRATGEIYVFEGAAQRGLFGTYAAGDVFRIDITSGVVTYKQNGVLLYTSATAPIYPLVGDAALYHTGATITAVTIAPL